MSQKTEITLVKMKNKTYPKELFIPIKTNTHLDDVFSTKGGLMRGTNIMCVGEPGIGKTTLLLDVIEKLQNSGHKVLFINAEMNEIDFMDFCNRFPQFNEIETLFMSDYSDQNPDDVLRSVLNEGYDCVLIDSWVELAEYYIDYFKVPTKKANSDILDVLELHNTGKNEAKLYTSFLLIQQLTKGGVFVGSNKLKHLTTGMMEMKVGPDGSYLFFSKNRRGIVGEKIHFKISKDKVTYDKPTYVIEHKNKKTNKSNVELEINLDEILDD